MEVLKKAMSLNDVTTNIWKSKWLRLMAAIFILIATVMFMLIADRGLSIQHQYHAPLDRDNHDNSLNETPASTSLHEAFRPSTQHEQHRRKVETTSDEFWYYIRSKLESLRRQNLSQEELESNIGDILQTSNGYQMYVYDAGLHMVRRQNVVLTSGQLRADVVCLERSIYELCQTSKGYQRTLRNDFHALKSADGLDEWRLRESLSLGRLVQNRLRYLQNPKDCSSARKLVCSTTICETGFTCVLHHYAMCLILAYATERTMVVLESDYLDNFEPLSETCTDDFGENSTSWGEGVENIKVVTLIADAIIYGANYLPLAVPEDLADRLERFHGNPAAWWFGQSLAYIFRPSPSTLSWLKSEKSLDHPYVGVHVRRTDKLREEAKRYEVSEYMTHVEDWFDAMALRKPEIKRNVFLATDDPDVITETIDKYPKYTFKCNSSISDKANPKFRNLDISQLGIIHDVYHLSRSDHIVCTFSSNVCRMAYALMQTFYGDASKHVTSLDSVFYMNNQLAHLVTVVEPIEGQLTLNVGDQVEIIGNYWDGHSAVMHKNKTGNVPSYKLVDNVARVKMPTYPNVEENTFPETSKGLK